MTITNDILQWEHIKDPYMMQALLTLAVINDGNPVNISTRGLGEQLGVTLGKARVILDKLVKSGVVSITTTQTTTQPTTQKTTQITFCKYVRCDTSTTQVTTQTTTQVATQTTIQALIQPAQTKATKETKKQTKVKPFAKPTIEEVKSYFKEYSEKNGYVVNDIEAERWMNHYTSNGWKVGRNAMKDWRGAIRNWILKLVEENPGRVVRLDISSTPAPAVQGELFSNSIIKNNTNYEISPNSTNKKTAYERNREESANLLAGIYGSYVD